MKYESPNMEFIYLADDDIITTSPGTDTPIIDEEGGIWSDSHAIN